MTDSFKVKSILFIYVDRVIIKQTLIAKKSTILRLFYLFRSINDSKYFILYTNILKNWKHT